MSFAKHKTVIEENDTVILYLNITNMHAIDVCPQIKNKKGELIEHVFQTNYGALKVKNLIGIKYGSKVSNSLVETSVDTKTTCFMHNLSISFKSFLSRLNCQKVGHMYCNPHLNYGHKPYHIEHRSFIHQISV